MTYQRTVPTGNYLGEAQNRIAELRKIEEVAKQEEKEITTWKAAQTKNTITAYQAYQKEYPKGTFFEDAEEGIAEVRKRRKRSKSKIGKGPTSKAEFGVFTDPRDGQRYRTVELFGQIWLGENLNFNIGKGSKVYEIHKSTGLWGLGKVDVQVIKGYGRLYTWEAAQKASPPGWHLPTDDEWKKLATACGGYNDWRTFTNHGDPVKAYKTLIQGGSSGFDALLGGVGYPNNNYSNLGLHGYYWSSTTYDPDNAWYYLFSHGKLHRLHHDRLLFRSCRYIKNS